MRNTRVKNAVLKQAYVSERLKILNYLREKYSNWSIIFDAPDVKEKKIEMSGTCVVTNDYAITVGIAYFTLIFLHNKDMYQFKLQFNGKRSQYLNRYYQLRYWLEDLVADYLVSAIEETKVHSVFVGGLAL